MSGSEADPCATPTAVSSEIQRQQRVINQMTTMHSLLSERYRFRGKVLEVVLILLSVGGATMAFASGTDVVSILGVDAQRTTWLGWLALAVVLVVLIELVFNLSEKGESHADAVRRLAALMSEYRVSTVSDADTRELERLTSLYQFVMDGLPPIPERQFNRLKAAHLQKVAISRYLSAHPGTSERRARRAVREKREG